MPLALRGFGGGFCSLQWGAWKAVGKLPHASNSRAFGRCTCLQLCGCHITVIHGELICPMCCATRAPMHRSLRTRNPPKISLRKALSLKTVTSLNKESSQEPRKGGFSKGVFCRVERHAQEDIKYQGYWAQQYIWHSERHSQDRRTFLQKPLVKTPFSSFLI